jgi:hypothetical protein
MVSSHFVYMVICDKKPQPVKDRVMNRLSLARQTQIISCLVEGNSIRSTERMTNIHRDTIMRLMVKVGEGCAKLADEPDAWLELSAAPNG